MEPTTHRPAVGQRSWLAGTLARPGRRLLGLHASRMLATARRRTGLDDFGDPSFREPLERLLDSLEREARLNLVGRIAAREDLTGMLVNRLKLERDRKQHPAIASEVIRRPLVITGLPRSGSTFLHGLLAQDPASRVPLHWELRFPSPPPTGRRTTPIRASSVRHGTSAGSSA